MKREILSGQPREIKVKSCQGDTYLSEKAQMNQEVKLKGKSDNSITLSLLILTIDTLV